jgi:hypothetical protein
MNNRSTPQAAMSEAQPATRCPGCPRPAWPRQACAAIAAAESVSTRPEPAGRQEPKQWLRKRGGRD